MVKQTIQIFCRLKPTKAKKCIYEIDNGESGDLLSFTIPKEVSDGFVNNRKEDYKFKFGRVFDQETPQIDIFSSVAEPVIENVLAGYNGTIFAYGQTGSGKTFTITGGPEKYDDRGIIPRTLDYFFEQFQKKPEFSYTMHVSYLEIYNESGFDLLAAKREAKKFEDLPKVSLLEDEDNNIHLKNLSVHQANSAEEGIDLLFVGDLNRMVAETAMNDVSTRSHCIFTIHITARETGSATIRKAKLHLVDLAGSERIGKTGANGVLLTEAKYINLSLHYLEQVIVALSEKNRSHVPYRNSMMTSVLRDSLGGNCMTTMIATCSVEKRNAEESISTCRFAQRVALIKNEALINEELDPKLIILRLKKEVEELKNQLALSTGTAIQSSDLTNSEIDKLKKIVLSFLDDQDPDASINVGADMKKINFCFKTIKDFYLEIKKRPVTTNTITHQSNEIKIVDSSHYDSKEMKDLKDTLKQRDNEINILVNMLKKEKLKVAELASNPNANRSVLSTADSTITNGSEMIAKISNKRTILKDMSIGRQEAFEIFTRDYEDNSKIEEQKKILKKHYGEAKALGEGVNQARNKTNLLKNKLEQVQLRIAATDSKDNKDLEELENLKKNIEVEREKYHRNFEQLKTKKSEIEHIQHVIERFNLKLQRDFETWWIEQCQLNEENQRNRAILDRNLSNSNRPSITSTSQISSTTDSTKRYDSFNSSRESSEYSFQKQLPNVKQSSNGDSKINLTGDKVIDANITAFINARKKILNQI